MRHFISLVTSTASAAAVTLVSFSAAAHIELIEPSPRYTLPANKSCPCGDGDSNRTCQDTAEESTDPNRSDNVATFEAGSTITVRADEYIDHAGRMRVAFDPDGADLADFNRPENILADEPDFTESGLSMATPHVWEFQVQLPTAPCDNCTLQVIQVMAGGTENPVLDPAPLSTYYTCADIRIVPAGTLVDDGSSAGGAAGAGGSAAAGQAGAGGASDGATGGSGATGGAAGTAAAAAGSGAVSAPEDESSDDSGCSLQPNRPSAVQAWAILALGGAFAALGLRRRQRSITA